MKRTRKTILILTTLTLLFMSLSTSKANTKTPSSCFDYENLTQEEALAFVNRYNIEIPDILVGQQIEEEFTRDVI